MVGSYPSGSAVVLKYRVATTGMFQNCPVGREREREREREGREMGERERDGRERER